MELFAIILIGTALAIAAGIVAMKHAQKVERERQAEIRREAIRKQNAIYDKYTNDFRRVGWKTWGYETHTMPGQRDRMERAIYSSRMVLKDYDSNLHRACVLGEHGKEYIIDESGCSCRDFQERRLPCKHMYFAVMEI